MYEEEELENNPLDGFWLEGDSLAPPCQADLDVVNGILDLAEPFMASMNLIYDLGCGDGRICIEATRRFSCDSVGCEIEPKLVQKFLKNVKLLGLCDKITIIEGDLCDINLDKVGIIVLYLLPESVELIRPKLLDAIFRGSILICNTWGPKGLKPKQQLSCGFANNCSLYLYDASCL